MDLRPSATLREVALAPDDIRVLEFLAEHRLVIVPQVSAVLGRAPSTAERRLRRLAGDGLVVRQTIFHGHPAACWITGRGLGCLGNRLPAPSPDLKEYRHDIGVAWLWLAAQNGAFGQLTGQVSERAMRSEDRRRHEMLGGPAEGSARRRHGIGVATSGPRGGLALHYPDLMLETATGHRVAVELELTGKGGRRLDRIMLGYAGDPRVDAVLYLCPRGRIGLQIQAAARRAGISNRVHVQVLAPGSPAGAPEPGRMAARRVGLSVGSRSGRRSLGRSERAVVAER